VEKLMRQHYRKLVAARLSPSFADAVELVEERLPAIAADQILIRNRFAGINAGFDTLLCRGEVPYVDLVPPFDLGVEAVGTVEVVGTTAVGFEVGDAVATTQRGHGYREYQVIDAARAVKIRAATPEILTLMPTGISALVGLEQVGEMKTGETILITAAAGGIGHIAVQLAKRAGNQVIGTCGSEAKEKLLKRLGCDRVINYRQENVVDVLDREYPAGLNLVFDCVGKQMFDAGIDHLALQGRFVIVGFISEYGKALETVTRPRIYEKLFWKSALVRGFLLPRYAEHVPAARDRLLDLYYNNQLQVSVDSTVFQGLESIPSAVSYLLSGQNCGKVVVRY